MVRSLMPGPPQTRLVSARQILRMQIDAAAQGNAGLICRQMQFDRDGRAGSQ